MTEFTGDFRIGVYFMCGDAFSMAPMFMDRKRPPVIKSVDDKVSDKKYWAKKNQKENCMKSFTAVIERCPDTGYYVGYVPGFPGAHSQGENMEELNRNLKEVIELLLEEGEPKFDAEFVGTQNVVVA